MAREDRLRVLARIEEYEAQGRFNEDVEEDDSAITRFFRKLVR